MFLCSPSNWIHQAYKNIPSPRFRFLLGVLMRQKSRKNVTTTDIIRTGQALLSGEVRSTSYKINVSLVQGYGKRPSAFVVVRLEMERIEK